MILDASGMVGTTRMRSTAQIGASHTAVDPTPSGVVQFVAALAAARGVDTPRDIEDFSNRPGSWAWAETHFKAHVRRLIQTQRAHSVMEIGGGRSPMFDEDEIASMGVRYVINDISERELRLAPEYVGKVCFDIAEPDDRKIPDHGGQYEIVFSRMVFEHVRDTRQAYRNIHRLLMPGGAGLNFHPVLYCPPFVLNMLLPEKLSRSILKFFVPIRTDVGVPKFPAWYDRCRVSARVRKEIRSIGFRDVWQIPFFYHSYFKNVPGLYEADRALSRRAERNNWNLLASYCYTVVFK